MVNFDSIILVKSMEAVDNTETWSEGRSAAVAARAEEEDSDSENDADSSWFSDARRGAQRIARTHQH